MLLQRERPLVPAVLPLPAPLPSLRDALARRAALFGPFDGENAPTKPEIPVWSRRSGLLGAAAALGALALAALPKPARATVAGGADARLSAMAADLDRTLDGAAFAFDPVEDEDDQDRRLDRANALQLEIAALPAVGLAGVLAKAKAYLDSNSYDTVNLAELADSLAEDIERVLEGRTA